MTELYRGLPWPRRTRAIVAVSFGSLMLTIDSSITSVVLPTIAKALQVEGSAAVFVVTVYQLILAMTLLPFAALGDRIGHRPLYQAGLILHSVAAALCFFAHNLPALLCVRALQALGTAAALSTAVGLLRGIYPVEWLGRGLAINTAANSVGSAFAPVLGGFIISVADWHWVFAAVVPFSLASLLLSQQLPAPERREHRFDLLGAGLCALTFGLLISGLEGAIHSDQLLLSIAIFACGAVVAWFFVRHEKGEAEPVLPVDLLAMPVIRWSVLAGFAATTSVMVMLLSLPFRLQQAYGFSPGEIGGIMAVYMILSSALSSLSGFVAERIPVVLVSTAGLAIAALGQLFLALLPEAPAHFHIVWPLCVCGLGFGLFFAPNVRHVVMAAPPKRSASAGSLNNTVRMLGYTISATLVAALLAFGFGEGPVPALVAMSLAALAGVISAFNLRRTKI